jgi:hypothetical protein
MRLAAFQAADPDASHCGKVQAVLQSLVHWQAVWVTQISLCILPVAGKKKSLIQQ